MKNKSQTIRKIVGYLNNSNEDGGGFWLPNIQRPFVWSEEQICRLFDSILREYPISTLLIWKSESKIRRRKFIDNWKSTLRLSDFYVPEDSKRKCLVLDGQQRLQSLYIGLRGSFEGKELFLDILSGDLAAPDDIKYKFEFRSQDNTKFPWVKFKNIVSSNKKRRECIAEIVSLADRELESWEKDKLGDHVDTIDRTFKIEETVTYQELDSIDTPSTYQEDDVVEIFIRANSGGTKLSKSDLLFSLLSASWDIADEQMDSFLEDINKYGFDFDRDFVLKVCLVLLDQGARYEVSKFRKSGVREEIQEKWDLISEAIQDVIDFVRAKTFIQCDKALPSQLVLMPLIYFRYKHKDMWSGAADVDQYIVRCSLAGSFSGQSDRIIDSIKNSIDDTGDFDLDEVFDIIRYQGRPLELAEDRFWKMGYGSKTIHLLFNLLYPSFSYSPAYNNNLPQIDHIFPQSKLREIKEVNPDTGRERMKYSDADRNQLANCMLLTKQENGSGGKWDATPEDWFSGKSGEYLDLHLIPRDEALWSMNRFEDFIEARKILIKQKFDYLLIQV